MKHANRSNWFYAVNAWWSNANLAALGNGHIHHTIWYGWTNVRTDLFCKRNREVFADQTLTEQMLPLPEHLRADATYSKTLAVPELVPTTGDNLCTIMAASYGVFGAT